MFDDDADYPPPPPPPPPPPVSEGQPSPSAWDTADGSFPAPAEVTKDERNMAMFCHIGTIIGTWLGLWGALVPLVIWLLKKDESVFIADQAKESMNFQITVLLAVLISVPLICFVVGVALLPVIGIASTVLAIVAGIKSAEGVRYRYPWTLRLIP